MDHYASAYRIFSRIPGYGGIQTMLRSLRKYQESEIAQQRKKIIEFYEKYGEKATKEAYGADRKVVNRWRQRYQDQGLRGLEAMSTRPRCVRQPQTPSKIIQFIRGWREKYPRIGKEKIKVFLDRYCRQERMKTISESSIGNILKRHKMFYATSGRVYHNPDGAWAQKKVQRRKRLRIRHPRRNAPSGHIVSDTVERISDGIKEYFYSAIDSRSKFALTLHYKSLSSRQWKDFYLRFKSVYPGKIRSWQSDNGSENLGEFDQQLTQDKIPHWFSYPRCPKINTYIERYNRTIQEEFIEVHWNGIGDPVSSHRKLADYLIFYNIQRPHHSLGLKTPMEHLLQYEGMSHMSLTYTAHCQGKKIGVYSVRMPLERSIFVIVISLGWGLVLFISNFQSHNELHQHSLAPPLSQSTNTHLETRRQKLQEIFTEWTRRYQDQHGPLSFRTRDLRTRDGVAGTDEFNYLKRITLLVYGEEISDISQEPNVASHQELVQLLNLLRNRKIITARDHRILTEADSFFENILLLLNDFNRNNKTKLNYVLSYGDFVQKLPEPSSQEAFLNQWIEKTIPTPAQRPTGSIEKKTRFLYAEYYRHTSNVFVLLTRTFEKLADQLFPPAIDEHYRVNLDQDFFIRRRTGYVFLPEEGFIHRTIYQIHTDHPDPDQLFAGSPEKLMKLFHYAIQRSLPISGEILEGARQGIHLLRRRSQHYKKERLNRVIMTVNNEFLACARENSPVSDVFWRMYESGLLGFLIPSFHHRPGSLVGLFTEPLHQLSVDAHTLSLLDSLEMIPDILSSSQTALKIHQEIVNNPNLILTLRLSILFHDTGKGRETFYGRGHSATGSQAIAPRELSYFPIPQETLENIQWVVKNHMMLDATEEVIHKNLNPSISDLRNQPAFQTQVLRLARDPGLTLERLKLLYLISWADKFSVEPFRIQPIIPQIMDEIFSALENLLQAQGQDAVAAFDQWREWARAADASFFNHLYGKLNQELLKDPDKYPLTLEEFDFIFRTYLTQFSTNYFQQLTDRPEEIEEIMGLIVFWRNVHHSIGTDAVHVRFSTFRPDHEKYFEVSIGRGKDSPGFLASASGVLAAYGFNIVGAEIKTVNGIICDRIYGYFVIPPLSPLEPPQGAIDALKEHLRQDLEETISGRKSVQEIFSRRGKPYRFDPLEEHTPLMPPNVSVDTSDGRNLSILKLNTQDRLGLLHIVATVLLERFGINIVDAAVLTYQSGTEDEFLFQMQDGNGAWRPLNEQEQQEVISALTYLLDRRHIYPNDLTSVIRGQLLPLPHEDEKDDDAPKATWKSL